MMTMMIFERPYVLNSRHFCGFSSGLFQNNKRI